MSPVSWRGMHRPGYWEPREVPAGFRKQVEEFAGQQDAIGISHLLSGTNRPERVSYAASVLAQMGTTEAKDRLLSHLVGLNSLSKEIWPYAAPLLTVDDVPRLMEFEERATRNSRLAAKYKIPPEVQGILTQYVTANIKEMPAPVLRRFLSCRYREVSDTTFKLLFENESPDIRTVLQDDLMHGYFGDRRKADKRAMIAFEELLRRAPDEGQRDLLVKARDSAADAVAIRATKMLDESYHAFYIRMIRKQGGLKADDIWALRKDGKPTSLARIVDEEKRVFPNNPSRAQKDRFDTLVYALAKIDTPESRQAMISLLVKLDKARDINFDGQLTGLCRNMADLGSQEFLPALKEVADRTSDIRMYAAINAILKIEGSNPDDESNRYAIRARSALAAEYKQYEEEVARISDVQYLMMEDLAEKKSDRGMVRYWEGRLGIYESVLHNGFRG